MSTEITQAAAQGLRERIKTLDYPQLISILLLASLVALVAYGIPWATGKVEKLFNEQNAKHNANVLELSTEETKRHAASINHAKEARDDRDKLWREILNRKSAALDPPGN